MIRIAHLSDTQIRNFQRHAEFRESYEHLYKSLHEKRPDFIVVAGDIAHSKTHISPEFVQLCSEYFTRLAKIAPLIIIPGNHDLNLNNLSRLDALTPIVDALDNPNISYYKNSGVYSWRQGINFVVFSCLDEKWPTVHTRFSNPDFITVGLYHGMVNGAILQNGMVVEDCPYTAKEFLKIVDYLMLGDIHRMQIIDENFRAAYCGSYPQQNFGESTEKGYLIWDIESRDKHEVDFVKLPNVCPYYIISLPDDLNLDDSLAVQDGARIRIDSRQLTPAEKNVLRIQVEKFYKPCEIFFKDDVNAHKQNVKIAKNIKIEDLSDVGVQNKLIRKFLEPYKLKPKMIDSICELNKKYDSAVRQDEEVVRNLQYKILRLWWNNMLSYGEDNSFDFSERKGITGIFGKNAVGKSSLAVDIPLYVMFNANSKGVVKNDELINDKKDSCSAGIDINVGDLIYRIKRETDTYLKSGKRKGKPVYQGRTKVEFKTFDMKGNEVQNKDDEKRQDTDKEIRKIFGTAEDYMATSIAPQWKLLDFIQRKDTERQKIIGRYFDVDSFDKKHKLANDDSKEIKGRLESLQRDFKTEKETLLSAAKEADLEIDSLKSDLIRHQEAEKRFSTDTEYWQEKILKVSNESKTIESLSKDIQRKQLDCISKKNEIDNLELRKKEFEQSLSQLSKEIDKIDVEKIKQEKEKWEEKAGDAMPGELESCREMKDSFNRSIKELEKYDCIGNIDCCMLDELRRVEKEERFIATKIPVLEKKIRKHTSILEESIIPLGDKIFDYYKNVDIALDLEKSVKLQEALLKAQKELFEKMMVEVKESESQKQLFVDKKDQIDKNNEYREIIKTLKQKRDDAALLVRETEMKIFGLENKQESCHSTHQATEEDEKTYLKLKSEHDAYFYYLETVGKNGLSRIIINNNLDIINVEMQKILSGNVDFNIEVQANEVGKIDVYFKHVKSKARRIELCSGMEKTIAAIAIRAALVSVTTLPKANIFVLDEVFTALDPEYIDATRKILQYLKNLFDSVIIITHIDGFKDLVDHVVEVHRDDQGFARVG